MNNQILSYDLKEGVYHVLEDKSLIIPEKFIFCINDSCSFRCKMCYNWTNKPNPKLKYNDWIKKLDEIYVHKKKDIEINIVGGEPLELPWAVDLIAYAKRLGFTVSLSTNGYHLKRLVENIVKSDLDNVSISLDGATAKTHDFVRGVKGSYDRIIEAIKCLKEYPKDIRPRIVIQSLIMGLNVDELEDLVYFASDEKNADDGIYFMVIMKPNSPKINDQWKETDKFNLWPKDINKALRKIQILYEMKNKGYKILNSKEQLIAFHNYFKNPDSFIKSKQCNVDDFGAFIESTGKVFICRDFLELGKVNSRNIISVLNSGKSKAIRSKMLRCKKNCNYLINCFYQDEKKSKFEEGK